MNELNNRLFEEKQTYQQLINQFEADYPEYYRLKYDDATISVTELQKTIGKEEAIISYIPSDTTVFIFLMICFKTF